VSGAPAGAAANARFAARRFVLGLACLSVGAGACGKERAGRPPEAEDHGTPGQSPAPAAASSEAEAEGHGTPAQSPAPVAASSGIVAESLPPSFGFGRSATPSEIAALDIDVRPDGRGLPPGSGTVKRGAAIFAARCAKCHGPTGTEGPSDVLVGREPREGFLFGQYTSLTRTIGNYWPYATTLYDYIHRAMPLDAPGSLTPDEVYSLAAWLLYRNEVLPADAVLDATTLPEVRMPARDRFVADDRAGGAVIR
jgi:cytochrome c